MQSGGAEIVAPLEPAVAAPVVALMLVACAASALIAARLLCRLRAGRPVVEPRPHPAVAWSGSEVAVVALVYVGLLVALAPAATSLRWQLVADIVTKLGATLAGILLLRQGGVSWAALGITGGRWREDLRLALGGLALMVAPLLGIAAALDRIVPYEHPVVAFLQQGRDPWAVGLVVLAAVVVAPIAEEFFFRRVLQGWLENKLPEADGAAAIGLSAAAFAAAHAGHGLAAAPLFLFAVVLGIVVRQTGSIVPGVILHALFNAVSVGLILLTPVPAAAGG